MPLPKPFKRTARPNLEGLWQTTYIKDPAYAEDGSHYVRSFLLVQKDFLELLDFVEPADCNLSTCSLRIHELLVRTCIELEASWRAILKENGYSRGGRWNVDDYRKINDSHLLSKYKIRFPYWRGATAERTPFQAWDTPGAKLTWYESYHSSKHDRQKSFEDATFETLIDAFAGLFIVISAQFHTVEFSAEDDLVGFHREDGWSNGVGSFLQVSWPHYPPALAYGFDWSMLMSEPSAFDLLFP